MLSGVDPTRVAPFGGLQDVNGTAIDLDALPANQVVINQRAAEALGAVPGDVLTIYYDNAPIPFTVAAIATESMISGARYPGYLEMRPLPGIVMPLARLQGLIGQEGRLSLIMVSNRGGVTEGEEATDVVVAMLQDALAGQPAGVAPVKQDGVTEAKAWRRV